VEDGHARADVMPLDFTEEKSRNRVRSFLANRVRRRRIDVNALLRRINYYFDRLDKIAVVTPFTNQLRDLENLHDCPSRPDFENLSTLKSYIATFQSPEEGIANVIADLYFPMTSWQQYLSRRILYIHRHEATRFSLLLVACAIEEHRRKKGGLAKIFGRLAPGDLNKTDNRRIHRRAVCVQSQGQAIRVVLRWCERQGQWRCLGPYRLFPHRGQGRYCDNVGWRSSSVDRQDQKSPFQS